MQMVGTTGTCFTTIRNLLDKGKPLLMPEGLLLLLPSASGAKIKNSFGFQFCYSEVFAAIYIG